jgi:putative membrane protein
MRKWRIKSAGNAARKILLIFALYAVAAFATSHAMAAIGDKSFVNKATIGNQFEIESSRLALQQSKNDDVKDFAQQMVDDHTQIGEDLTSVIATSNAQIPVPDNKLDPAHAKILAQLRSLPGSDFDHLYLKNQIKAHDDAIALFTNYIAHGKNSALRDFANRTLPIIKKHRDEIPEVE